MYDAIGLTWFDYRKSCDFGRIFFKRIVQEGRENEVEKGTCEIDK